MHYPVKKLFALLLAVWLPFFSGHALATSITMQMMAGSCPMIAAMHDHAQTTQQSADQDQAAGHGSEGAGQNSSCHDNGVCHFACMGYLAAVDNAVKHNQPAAQTYLQFSILFQSITSAPLDPPPLARV